MGIQFKPEVGTSPVEVTLREKRDYTINLAAWLQSGQTISTATARITDSVSGSAVSGATSGLLVTGGNKVSLTVDWRVAGFQSNRKYKLWIKVEIGAQLKEGFAEFLTHFQ
jgi:hypothetical protein